MKKVAVLFVFVAIVGLSIATSYRFAEAEASATIDLISPPSAGSTLGEIQEYRTLVWQDPWDMNNSGDLVQLDSPCTEANQFSTSEFSGGIWTGVPATFRSEAHWINLLSPEFPSTLPLGMDGRAHPIDPTIYTQLTIKMYVSSVDPATDPGARLTWTRRDGRDGNNGSNTTDWGDSNYFRTYSGWHIYSVDLTKIGLLSYSSRKLQWANAGKITGLTLYPTQKSKGKTIKIDWVRLSPKANYPVGWSVQGTIPTDAVSFDINGGDGLGALPIHFYEDSGGSYIAPPVKILASAGLFSFPASLPPGNHTLTANSAGASDSGLWKIDAIPLLTFSNPTYSSGEEYATTVLGDPWDFNSLDDIDRVQNIDSAVIENGTYKATHPATGDACSNQWSDSAVYLRMGAPVDPEKFRYFSFDVRLAGTADILDGWMSRVFWYDPQGFPNIGSTNDIINRNGWNTHILDLWRTDIQDDGDPGLRGWKDGPVTQLRIDVDTVPQAQTFYLDNVKLFAQPVSTGVFTITWTVSEQNPLSITLGYDSDQSGYNGTVIATGLTGASYRWDTHNVPDGLYYLYALVTDGVNQSRFYSKVPVQVVTAVENAAFTNPDGAHALVKLGTEFARDVLLNPWDMSSIADIDKSVADRYIGMSQPVFDGQTMSVQSTTHDPYFWLSWDITKPIDAAKFNRLTFRIYSDRAGQGQLWWFTDAAQSQLIEGPYFTVAPGWQLHTIDLAGYPGWNGSIRVLRLDPLDKADAAIKLDWVRLNPTGERTFPVQWTGDNMQDSVLDLYYADNPAGSNKHSIVTGLDGSSGSYMWDTTHLVNGTHYLFGYISVKNAPGIWFTSQNGVKIPNAQVTMNRPASTGTVTGETADYRSLVWRDPWDMNEVSDLQQLDSPCLRPNQYSGFDFSNGVWTGVPNTWYQESHWISLLSPGYRGALPVDIDGRLRPIDPKVYTQLTIKMYVSAIDPQTDPGARILWTRRDLKAYGDGAESAHWGESNYFRTYPGWHIYSIDLTKVGLLHPGLSGLEWTQADKITGLRIDPDQKSSGKVIKIDWVRLSPRGNQQISWNSQGTSDLAEIHFAVNSGDGLGAVPIHFYENQSVYDVTQPVTLLAKNGGFTFPAALPPGSHTLQASVSGATGSGLWQIDPAPLLTFTSPSPYSGEEYAATELGDPWDFESLSDLDGTQNVINPEVNNGVYKGTHEATGSPCSQQWSDSGVFLRMGTPIDPAKYRYLSFKLRMDGDAADISNGWMTRVIWYDAEGFPNVGTSEDIINRVGWNTHTIDMWRTDLRDDEDPGLRDWRQDLVTQLRIDLDEVPQTQTSFLDYVSLHAQPVASGNYLISWSLSEQNGISITLGYDTDNSGLNGVTITSGVTGTTYLWSSSTVPDGLYYLYAIVSDGINRVGYYSDAPVQTVKSPSSVSFTQPNGAQATVATSDEFARDVLQNPWDFNGSDDLDRSDGGRYNGMTEPVFNKGRMSFTSTNHDPYFWLSWNINKPIDAGRFNRLAIHMYSNKAGQGQLWWFTHEANSRFIEGPKFTVSPGWRVYYFDLSGYPGWGGSIRLLRVDPLDRADATIQFDWVRLTPKNERVFTVMWQGQNLQGSEMTLYYSTDRQGTEKHVITEKIPAQSGQYAWDTSELLFGTYYILGHLTNGAGGGVWTYSTHQVGVGIDPNKLTRKLFIPVIRR